MPKTLKSNSEIDSLVTDFTTQLSDIVRRSALEQVLASLGGLGATGAPSRGRSTGPRRKRMTTKRGKGGKRTSADVEKMGERLLIFVKKNPGKRGEQISKAMGMDTLRIRLPMQKLIEARKVKTKGQRRGMTYFPA